MSRIDEWDENERALYAVGSRALLDDLERQRREWNESYALDSTSIDEINRTHAARMRALEEDHKQWLARYLDGLYADDEAPTEDVARQISQDASGSGGEPATPGPGSAGQPDHAADQLTSDDIKAMDMQEFAALRQRMGIGNASGRGMFG